jgi:hypothetical protein
MKEAATPTKKREVKADEKQASSARRISDKTFKQKMAELQAEAQGEKPASKKELFPAKRATEAPSSVIETKRAKK